MVTVDAGPMERRGPSRPRWVTARPQLTATHLVDPPPGRKGDGQVQGSQLDHGPEMSRGRSRRAGTRRQREAAPGP